MGDCAASMRLAPARNRCPLCRSEIHDIVHIDVAHEEAEVQALAPVSTNHDTTEENVAATEQASIEASVSTTVADVQIGTDCQQILATDTETANAVSASAPRMEDVRAARLRALDSGQ